MIISIIGFVALEKTIKLYKNNKKELKNYFSEKFIDSLDRLEIEQYNIEINDGYVYEMNTGIHRALWEMKEELECGFEIDAKKIPLLQETVEVLEYFKEDFFDSESKGAFLIVSNEFIDSAKIIGHTTKGHAGNIHIDERVRHIDRPKKYRG